MPPVGIPAHTIPGGGTLPGVPSPARSKAVEHALEAERLRVKDLEPRERDMDAAELRVALRRERRHSQRLAADLAALWSSAVQSQAEAEVSEENRINGLMRRLDRVQREKGRIIVELEREEEMVRRLCDFVTCILVLGPWYGDSVAWSRVDGVVITKVTVFRRHI